MIKSASTLIVTYRIIIDIILSKFFKYSVFIIIPKINADNIGNVDFNKFKKDNMIIPFLSNEYINFNVLGTIFVKDMIFNIVRRFFFNFSIISCSFLKYTFYPYNIIHILYVEYSFLILIRTLH